jgi:predicted NAD/FAD-binding protein
VTVPVTANPPAVVVVESETDCRAAVVVVVGDVLEEPLHAAAMSATKTVQHPAIVRRSVWVVRIDSRAAVQSRRHVHDGALSHAGHHSSTLCSQSATCEDNVRPFAVEAFRKSAIGVNSRRSARNKMRTQPSTECDASTADVI